MVRQQIEHWQGQYADHHAEEIKRDVISVFGNRRWKIAHSEHLKSLLPAQVVEEELRSDAALTMALLGLIGKEAVTAPRIGAGTRSGRGAA